MADVEMYKTTIEIWTDFNPSHMELDDLARNAISGGAYCTQQEVSTVTDPAQLPDSEGFHEFFGLEDHIISGE